MDVSNRFIQCWQRTLYLQLMLCLHRIWVEMQLEMPCKAPIVSEAFLISFDADRLRSKFGSLLTQRSLSGLYAQSCYWTRTLPIAS